MVCDWDIRLTNAAEEDFRSIITWTADRFGEEQAGTYAGMVSAAIEALSGGPEIIGVKRREDIDIGIYTLHVAQSGYKGRHLVVFCLAGEDEPQTIYILRILHDAMDIQRHLPPDQ